MATYDRASHRWSGQCPHGDMCSGCDARGYCTREENDPTMSDETPRLRIVPAPNLPALPEGTERVVAELTEMMTAQMAKAAIAGFKLGVEEVTKMLAEHGHLDGTLAADIQALADKWEDTP